MITIARRTKIYVYTKDANGSRLVIGKALIWHHYNTDDVSAFEINLDAVPLSGKLWIEEEK